jgi:DNA-binding GntR family transcriptional regulator
MGYYSIIYTSDLGHRARSVYMYLRDHADKEGRCWPGIQTIAAELRLSRSTVKRALSELCREGLIVKAPRWRENGSYTSNLYQILQ